jgi:hypothetical protein
MPSDAHTLYAESLARALLKENLEGEGQLFESSKEYIVTLRAGLPEPDLHGTRPQTIISSIIKDYQGWGPATPVVSTIHSPQPSFREILNQLPRANCFGAILSRIGPKTVLARLHCLLGCPSSKTRTCRTLRYGAGRHASEGFW